MCDDRPVEPSPIDAADPGSADPTGAATSAPADRRPAVIPGAIYPAPAPSAGRTYGGLSAEQRREARLIELRRVGRELFADRGFSATGVRELCRAAKIGERSFYDTVGSREALLRDVYLECTDEVVADIRAAITSGPTDLLGRMHAGLAAFFGSIQEDPRRGQLIYVESLGRGGEIEVARREGLSRFVQVVLDEMVPYLGDAKATPEVYEVGVSAAILAVGEIAYRMTDGDPGFSAEQAVERLTAALAGGALALGFTPQEAPVPPHA